MRSLNDHSWPDYGRFVLVAFAYGPYSVSYTHLMEVAQQRRHRQNAVGVLENGLDDVDAGHGDGVVRSALAVDDLVGRVLHFLVDALASLSIERLMARQCLPIAHRNAADGGGGPQRDLGIAVLTGDVCVHVLDVHTGLLGDEEAQTSRVEVLSLINI